MHAASLGGDLADGRPSVLVTSLFSLNAVMLSGPVPDYHEWQVGPVLYSWVAEDLISLQDHLQGKAPSQVGRSVADGFGESERFSPCSNFGREERKVARSKALPMSPFTLRLLMKDMGQWMRYGKLQ